MSNVGKWERFYVDIREPRPYGDSQTYLIGQQWLEGCDAVEDWGCGMGWFRNFIRSDRYRGIDGSHSKFADVVADLVVYKSEVSGIFMRHVLEHDSQWQSILDNALASFTYRMALVLFTPLSETTHIISTEPGYNVPNISFAEHDIVARFPSDIQWKKISIKTATQFGIEHVYLLERGSQASPEINNS